MSAAFSKPSAKVNGPSARVGTGSHQSSRRDTTVSTATRRTTSRPAASRRLFLEIWKRSTLSPHGHVRCQDTHDYTTAVPCRCQGCERQLERKGLLCPQ